MADVGVNVSGGRDVSMPEPFLDVIDVPALINENACRRMPKVVISHLGQSMTLQGALKTPRKTVGTIGDAIRILKDIIVVMVARAEPCFVVLLLVL